MKKSNAQPKAGKEKKDTESPAVVEETTGQNSSTENVEEEKQPESNAQPKAGKETEVGTVTSQIISSSATPVQEDKRMVKVKVQYPEDYKGKKYLKDGEEIPVSPETAEEFVKKGIAIRI